MKSLKNDYYIIRISQSTLGTSNWWISVLVQEKETGLLYIIRDLDHFYMDLFQSYKESEEEGIDSTGIALRGNRFIKDKLKYYAPSTEEEFEEFIRYFLDKEKIKAKIKENNRQAKLNILL